MALVKWTKISGSDREVTLHDLIQSRFQVRLRWMCRCCGNEMFWLLDLTPGGWLDPGTLGRHLNSGTARLVPALCHPFGRCDPNATKCELLRSEKTSSNIFSFVVRGLASIVCLILGTMVGPRVPALKTDPESPRFTTHLGPLMKLQVICMQGKVHVHRRSNCSSWYSYRCKCIKAQRVWLPLVGDSFNLQPSWSLYQEKYGQMRKSFSAQNKNKTRIWIWKLDHHPGFYQCVVLGQHASEDLAEACWAGGLGALRTQ